MYGKWLYFNIVLISSYGHKGKNKIRDKFLQQANGNLWACRAIGWIQDPLRIHLVICTTAGWSYPGTSPSNPCEWGRSKNLFQSVVTSTKAKYKFEKGNGPIYCTAPKMKSLIFKGFDSSKLVYRAETQFWFFAAHGPSGDRVLYTYPIDDAAEAYYARYGFFRVEGSKRMCMMMETIGGVFE